MSAMPTYTTRGSKVAEAFQRREDVKTHGALSAANVAGLTSWDAGQLAGDDLARFRADCQRIRYVVQSYATPIAWETDDGLVHIVKQRFSMTTSHHQGRLYLFAPSSH
jgi:hypothetical protein